MNRKVADQRVAFIAEPGIDDRLRAELEALAAMDDADIDMSDIPELDEAFWQNAERGRFYRPVKQSTTVRIDADVLHWLKMGGRGYQTRINAILRAAMMRERISK